MSSQEIFNRGEMELPGKSEVQFWLYRTGDVVDRLPNYIENLPKEEQERASSIISEDARKIFILARGLLRQRLSRILDCAPRDVTIAIDLNGKPYLGISDGSARDLHFNISHSGDQIALVFSCDGAVGVDIECARRISQPDAIARDICDGREYAHYLSQTDDLKESYLLDIWTRKEALLKALGQPRSFPPNQFSGGEHGKPQSVLLDGAPYHVASLNLDTGIYGAIARKHGAFSVIKCDDD